jgi:hypothetical protein
MAKVSFKNTLARKTKNALGSTTISLEAIKKQIRVLDELKAFIPPPITEEYNQLEKNILQYGCKDSLVIWETTELQLDPNSESSDPAYILVDGHNRHIICVDNSLPFSIQLMAFSSLIEVKDYMIDLQLGRRNLTPQQASYFRGLRYQNEKLDKGKYNRDDHKVHNEPYGSTAEKLAHEFKVSTSTIKRDAQLAEGLSKLDKSLRDKVLVGEVKIDRKEIKRLTNLPEEVSVITNISELRTSTSSKKEEKDSPEDTISQVLKLLSASVKELTKSKQKQQLNDIKMHIKTLEKIL